MLPNFSVISITNRSISFRLYIIYRFIIVILYYNIVYYIIISIIVKSVKLGRLPYKK